MKRKLRGLKRRDIQLDFSLYRVDVPIRGLPDMKLSVVHLWPEEAENTMVFVHGFAQIISRKRDTILAGEYSVYPRDIEEVLYENSKVQEVAVVGVPTESMTQRVKAFVVPRPGTHLSKEELLDLCRKRLQEYAVPWDIEFREELPKSFVGKVLRRLLIEK